MPPPPPPPSGEGKEEGAAPASDDRRSWIDSRIFSSLKLKQSDIKKLDENEESRFVEQQLPITLRVHPKYRIYDE